MKPTKNGNIEATFKPHLKSEPVTVFLRPRIDNCYFSPTQHGARHGRFDAVGVKRAYEEHLRNLDEVKHPTISVSLIVEDSDDRSRRPEFGWDKNPSLIVRGQPVNNAEGMVRAYRHMVGEGYNHVCWSASSSLEGMTDTERKALGEAFDKVLLDVLPGMVEEMIEGSCKQAREALDEFIRECEEEIKTLKGIK